MTVTHSPALDAQVDAVQDRRAAERDPQAADTRRRPPS